MKTKTNIIIYVAIVIGLIIGVTAYAQGPGIGYQRGNTLERYVFAMMGDGMMGGYGRGHGMMDGYGRNNDNRYRQSPREYRQDRSNSGIDIESLRNQIQEKRHELSSLLRSKNADKTEIDRRIEELGNLERELDQRISSGY